MSEFAALHQPLSVEQYLALERNSLVRHEFVGGKLYAMTGTSKRHNLIAGNIFRNFSDAADGTDCQVFISDVKVRTPDDAMYYSDVMVVCESSSDDPYVEKEPCLIVEVISPSTEGTDLREKVAAYKRIPSLKAYLIVDQERPRVERHFRTDQGDWL
jgi:Uma2 family endonuclease